MNKEKSGFDQIPTTDILVMKDASKGALLEAGWDTETLRKIHDNTVKWWFDEKP